MASIKEKAKCVLRFLTKQIRQLISPPPRMLNVSKTGIINYKFKDTGGFVGRKRTVDQVQVMALLTLCIPHSNGAPGNHF